jgi:predicted nucleotidyltransferase
VRSLPTRRGADEHGQASVELVALLPLVGLLAALLWQALLAGETVWLSGGAARAAARAVAVGVDPIAAARAVLPSRLERGLDVTRESDGGVALVLRVPAALGDGTIASVTTRARFEAQR